MCHQFEVFDINAAAIIAAVVNFKAFWDESVAVYIRLSVGIA
jgi:hypothetical protein